MNILFINLIGSTHENGVITTYKTNHDSMAYNMARGFIKQGHNVTLAVAEDFKPSDPENNPFEVIYFKSRMPKIFHPALLPFPKKLSKYLNDNSSKFDMILTTETFSIASLIATRHFKEKTVIWQEMPLHQKKFFKIPAKTWYNIIARFFMQKAIIIPQSLRAKNFIKKYMKNVSEEIVDHGVDEDKFIPTDYNDNSFVVIARLVPGKQINNIISKFHSLVKLPEYSDYILHIIGEGPERTKLEDLIRSLNLQKNVILHGFLTHDEMLPITKRTKGLLIDTLKDQNVVSISESIASGTPVLMNTIPNQTDFVNDNNLGIAKDKWDYHDLIYMIKNYELHHNNCIAIRNKLTDSGCANSIVQIFSKQTLNAKEHTN